MLGNSLRISVLCDIPDSFFLEKIDHFETFFLINNISLKVYRDFTNIPSGGILILISSQKILSRLEILDFEKCVVVHPSKLPNGRGSAAVANYVLEGRQEIWVTGFEPNENLDSGGVYFQDFEKLEGHELLPEIRELQYQLILKLLLNFLINYPVYQISKQSGESSFYKKRTPLDSQLDIFQSIDSQFNKLRIVDNDRYPAFFVKNGVKYILKIEKAFD
jgi:methionyl-tRNA formyltransferase